MSEISYSTINVSGDDAFEFLQAQLATDLSLVANRIDADGHPDGPPHRSTWCNPKGRVICTPTVTLSASGFNLNLPESLSESVLQRLTMFRFRSKVEFAITATDTLDETARLHMLRAGIPEIAQAQTEKFTPHMLNLDILQMISVEKGCYPGQEIVARTHFRGASKRRMFRFSCNSAATAGDKVANGERDVGEVVNALQGELLAVVPADAVASSLYVNNSELQRLDLPYQVQMDIA